MTAPTCAACGRPKADHLCGYYTDLRAAETAVCANIPVAVPPEHQASSSGALGTPDRNNTCPVCRGLGEVSIYPCTRCVGSGELTAKGAPELRPATPPDWEEFAAGRDDLRVLSSDVLRRKVSKARPGKKLGVR